MRVVMLYLLLALALLPTLAFSQNLNTDYVSSLLWTGVNDVWVRDSLVYLAMANGLTIVNIADPAHPAFESKLYSQGYAQGIAVSGNYCYLADGTGGLQVINVSDPAHPAFVSSLPTPGFAIDVYLEGSYAYIADNASGLQVINISNPAAPVIVGSFATPARARSLMVVGSYCYIAADSSGLRIVNISDPANPAYASLNLAQAVLLVAFERGDTVADGLPFREGCGSCKGSLRGRKNRQRDCFAK